MNPGICHAEPFDKLCSVKITYYPLFLVSPDCFSRYDIKYLFLSI